MIQKLRKGISKSPFFRKLVGYHIASSGLFDKMLLKVPLSAYWQKRLDETIDCADNAFIKRVPNAGQVKSGKQIMHNGLKIYLGSYYGMEVAQILQKNKGVHEPQEERVFQEVLRIIPTGSVMIELGAFWSFYSAWFNQEVENARNFMVEPEEFNLGQGKRNFALNHMKGDFTKAFVGKESGEINGTKVICIDNFVKEKGIDFIHLLHSDIQGFEYDMLLGAEKTIDAGKVGYVFISTHSNKVHNQCKKFLLKKNFVFVAESAYEHTFSEDGLLVAVAPNFQPKIDYIQVDLKKYAE